MDTAVIMALRARSIAIRDRWERLLRVERVSGPLANPDSLLYYIPTTLDHVLDALVNARRRAVPVIPSLALRRPSCSCGHNPYLAYYVAGEQALLEALVFVQSESGITTEAPQQASILQSVIRSIAAQEIDTFCSVCTHQGAVPGCIRRAGRCAQDGCEAKAAASTANGTSGKSA
jgi:hypothetical protein